MDSPQLYLASSSPRRQELLQQVGIRLEVVVPDVDETALPGESAEQHVVRLALAKAKKGREMLMEARLPVLGSDTSVVVDGEVLGKPRNRQHAAEMMCTLSGRTHRVVTAVAMVGADKELYRLSESKVTFRPLQQAEIDAYWASGEPHDKAGGYAIQGLGAIFIERIDGSFSGVMGLPLFEVAELLKAFSIDVLQQE